MPTNPGPLYPSRLMSTKPQPQIGQGYTLEIYSSPDRESGRRLVLRDGSGKVLADTGDQYDFGNAYNRLEWLCAKFLPIPEGLAREFSEHPEQWAHEREAKPGGSVEGVYYRRWLKERAALPL